MLTEEAKFDTTIVDEIKKQLCDGKTVVITSGLLRAIQDKGINDIDKLRYTDRKALVQDFTSSGTYRLIHTDKPIIIPQINYLTNDSWEIASGINGADGWPILHEADYSKGQLYILTIPDTFADLYNLPAEVLNKIREVMCKQMNIQIEGSSQVSLFIYDNNTFIVESFLDTDTEVKMITPKQCSSLTDLSTKRKLTGETRKPGFSYIERKSEEKNVYTIILKPHPFRVFKME